MGQSVGQAGRERQRDGKTGGMIIDHGKSDVGEKETGHRDVFIYD